MFEAFPSLRPLSQTSLSRLSQILPETKPHPFSQQFDLLLQSFFDQKEAKSETTTNFLNDIYEQPFSRHQFYELLRRALSKVLKRELKKIEELINLHSSSQEHTELSRIKLDKIIKECLSKIESSSELMHEFIEDFETYQQLNCTCKKDICEQRQSVEQFIVDIFGFFVRSSQVSIPLKQVFNRQIEGAHRRKVTLNSKLQPSYLPQMKDNWEYGNQPGQVIIQIEKDCQKAKSKKQKRRQQKKNKHKPTQNININILDTLQDDKQQCILNNFLQTFTVQQDRQPCIVTEDWIQKIAHKYTRK